MEFAKATSRPIWTSPMAAAGGFSPTIELQAWNGHRARLGRRGACRIEPARPSPTAKPV